ncbi:hypothetical protein M5F00_05285 [Acinetobacter sp. ANC 4945]|uniref:Uncharacterized protein n=1 Tax=Acinetobacter amyesii TaxID=2942470 RepID=A0A1T1GWJ1_9GAMM|nr:hypothetical protein [Acinetobacter amyesii]MCL6247279.1 hypothetical protein [Acinetobacter amyesii]OOV81830.1 hypothetical protein B1202_10300 [Acinetobacter amyesii]
MKYLTLNETRQKLTEYGLKFDDFIDLYESRDLKIYLKHSGFIIKNSVDANSKVINGYYLDSIKPFRGIVEPLDDLTNQDIVSSLLDNPNSIIYATIDNDTYTLLRTFPTDMEPCLLESYAQFYTASNFLIEVEQFDKLFSFKGSMELRTEKSLILENQKLLRIIGGMLAGIKHSDRYKDLKQNKLYELMAQAIDTQKLGLSDDTVKPIFSDANKAISKYLIKNNK